MSFPLFFRGLVLVLIIFAAATFFLTHSWWTTIVHTIVCGVLIQIGYFAAVLFLIWRSSGKEDAGEKPGRQETKMPEKGPTEAAAPHLRNASRSRHS